MAMTTISFDEFELDVQYAYIPEYKGGWDDPSYPGYYEIGDIYYKGVEVSELLVEFAPNFLDIIQEQLTENQD